MFEVAGITEDGKRSWVGWADGQFYGPQSADAIYQATTQPGPVELPELAVEPSLTDPVGAYAVALRLFDQVTDVIGDEPDLGDGGIDNSEVIVGEDIPTEVAQKAAVAVRPYLREGHLVHGYDREGPAGGTSMPEVNQHFIDAVEKWQREISQRTHLPDPVQLSGNPDRLPYRQWQQRRQKRIAMLFESEPEVRIRLPIDMIVHVVADGQVRNQHETGISSASFDPTSRSMLERAEFAITDDFDAEAYPIYGYLEGSHEGHHDPLASLYGSVVLHLKPHVSDRTTWTGDDSLNANSPDAPRIAPSPVTKPSALSLPSWLGTFDHATSLRGLNTTYLEAQIHGGVRIPDDVAAVTFTQGDVDEDVKANLEALGVKVYVTDRSEP